MICSINPFAGLAGDMLLAALIDAGAPLDAIRAAITATGLTDWELTAAAVVEHGIAATRVEATVRDSPGSRTASELIAMAARSAPARVAEIAVRALSALAQVEARLHGSDAETVHLHELGGHDTLIDMVGVAAALDALGIGEVACGPLPLGVGRVSCAHGVLPVPAPATLALLEGAELAESDLPGETVTPTAAALLMAVGARYGPPPAMTLGATGYGAGTRRLSDRPNIAGVCLGTAGATGGAHGLPAVELATNLDDVTGELLGHVIDRALEAGARDAWVVPAVMKKGRPAHVLHVLAEPETVDRLERLVLRETGSLGVRRTEVRRSVLPRSSDQVEFDGVRVRVKSGPFGAKPEFDDVAAAARALGIPLRHAAARALAAHTERGGDDADA